jgi:NADH-quinone oxidoreductase subunit C
MSEEEQKYIEKIAGQFSNSFLRSEEFRGDLTLHVRKNEIIEVMRSLKESEDTAFDFLVDITVVDYLKLGGDERYSVVYHLYSHTYFRRLRVKAWVPEDDLNVQSMVSVWKTANWMEREAAELFGITFTGHPDPRNLLLPEDFPGFPLRKDYPLEGEGYRSDFPDLKNS